MSKDQKPYRRLAVYSSLIFILPSTLLGGYFVGYLVDEKFGSEPWGVVVGVFVGIIGSFIQIFRLVK
jgi:F0F1-type ATP synthase assembly protein I